MKTKTYLILMVVGVLMLNLAYAVKNTPANSKPPKAYPTGCKPIGYEFSNGILELTPAHLNPDQKQVIYFIHNISKQETLFSDQRSGDAPYIIHNNITIKPDGWAAYAADKVTRFICSNNQKNPTIESIVDCENTVKLCEYQNVKFAPNNRGNYWATTNMTITGIVTEIIHQGILLKS